MPRTWVKRAWRSGIQDEEALAGLFSVSVEAMHNRLIHLGFIGDDRRPIAEYFRSELSITTALAHAVRGGER